MIYIVAIMQPGKLESVQDALTDLGVTGTVSYTHLTLPTKLEV